MDTPKPQTPTSPHPASIRAYEMQLAMNIAKARERSRWELGYLGLLMVGTGIRWAITLKFPTPMLLPISAVATICAYELDTAYLNKLHRISKETVSIASSEQYKYFGKT